MNSQLIKNSLLENGTLTKSSPIQNDQLNSNPALNYVLCDSDSSRQQYQQQMTLAAQGVERWLSDPALYSGLDVASLARAINLNIADEPQPAEQVIEQALRQYLDHSLKVHHPHCVAHLHCPTLIISQTAELLMNASNQSMDSWDQSPAATVIEMKLIAWLRELVGYSTGDAGVFTSGGTQSNLMGLLLARDAVVQRVWGIDVRTQGLPPDAQRLRVICSSQAHFSVQKNMALLGLGYQSVVAIACNAQGQMDTQVLQQTIAQLQQDGYVIAAIVATAGTTDIGAIDPLQPIADIAKQQAIWLHVDAAWGGALLLSNQYRHWLDGMAQADSITLDFHKHFFQPISCGAFLLKDPAHFGLMHYQADYLNSAFDEMQGVPNLVARSLQTTRRFDALKLWMSLQHLGTAQFGALVERGIELAQQVAAKIADDAQLQLMIEPQLSSVLFRLNNPTDVLSLTPANLDLLNQQVADHLLYSGQANVGVTRFQEQTCLKLTILNPVITLPDLEKLLVLVKQQAAVLIQKIKTLETVSQWESLS